MGTVSMRPPKSCYDRANIAMAKRPEKKKESEDFYTSSDMKRHMSALIEHVDDRITGIGEQFIDFRRKLDSHTEMLGELAEDVAVIRTDVGFLKDDMVVVKKDISIMKEDISEIKDDLQQKVDRGEFAALERRVSAVEAKATI